MSIIKIHLYRQQSTKQQKYLLTYIPEIHQTIASFLQFAINALYIDICQIDNLVVENDGYTIPQCLDAKILQKINSLTIKVKSNLNENRIKLSKISELVTTPKLNDKQFLQQQNQNLRERMEQENLSDSSTPKFSQDGITKNKQQIITQKISNKKLNKKIQKQQKNIKTQTKKSKKPQVNQPQSSQSQSDQSPQQKKPTKKLQLKKGKKMESFRKQSSSQSSQQSSSEQQKEESSQSGNESSSQSSQSSEQELPRVIRTKKAQLKEKIHEKQLQKYNKLKVPSKDKQIVQKDKKNPILQKFTKSQKPLQQKQQLPTKKVQIKPFNNNIKPQPKQIPQNKSKPSFPVTYANRKKLIQADDIQSSDSSSSQQQITKSKVKVNEQKESTRVNNARDLNKGQQHKLSHVQQQQQQRFPSIVTTVIPINNNNSNNRQKMLPPSLRNKPIQQQQQQTKQYQKPQFNKPLNSSFKQHQLQQWITVTKQLIAKYKQSLPSQNNQQLPFLKVNNFIRFKQIQLDQQRFVPKQSQWIEGTVNKVQPENKIVLSKVTQLGKQYRDRYETYEHNMVVLEVNRNYLTQEQRNVIDLSKQNNKDINTNQQKQQTVKGQQQQSLTTQQKVVENSQKQQQQQSTQQKPKEDKNSVQKFICGQVNYYFSDKNYPFDLFMQMHANKNPQKYIPIRFLLNFPKIKKILKDQHKLLQYLVEDEKRNQRNFQVDESRKLVRKKVLKIDQDQEQQRQQKIEEQQKAQHQNENVQQIDTPQHQ